MTKNEISNILSSLPDEIGIYQFIDKNGKTIYVGKAKSIKKRVSSYFTGNANSYKTQLLVKKINSVTFTLVNNESDALLLENNLIKELQPTYNVLLKDDKTYPWICIKNEEFPRVFYTRQKQNDKSSYFGPFTSVMMVKTILNLIRQLYPLRTCNHKLSDENIAEGKFDVCLQYHIKNCMGPCEGKILKADYQVFVDAAEKIVKGDIHIIQNYLKKQMIEFSDRLEFEKAAQIKEKIDIIESYQAKSTIVSSSISNLDIFGYVKDVNSLYVNYLKVQNGAVVQTHTVELRKKIEENDEDLLLFAITEIRKKLNSKSKEVVVPFEPSYSLEKVKWYVPKRGDKLKLMELSQRNAKFYMLEKHKRIEKTNPDKHIKRKLETLKSDLKLNIIPKHIECFDISNIQGTNITASCVVFRDTKPSKKEYRHYSIKTVDKQDDYAAMREVVERRYKYLLDNNLLLPDLIVIDGGKGQLNAAIESLNKLDIFGKSSIIGIAKRLEEIYFPGDSVPLYLDKTGESLKVIQHARNEAHRFVINLHRKQRSDKFLNSELNQIKGVGDKTIKTLLSKTKSVKNAKSLSVEELSKIVGSRKAALIYEYFHNKKPDR